MHFKQSSLCDFMRNWLLWCLLNTAFLVVSNAEVKVIGSPKVALQVKDGQGHALHHPLQLWCQAVDQNTHNKAIKINSAVFYPLRDKSVQYDGRISKNGENASLSLEQVPAIYAGNWTCILNTTKSTNSFELANGTIQVLLRPIAWNTNSSMRIDAKHNEFILEASGVTVLRGKDTELTCPIAGNPKPDVFWTKDNKNVTEDGHISFNGTTLIIKNATDAHGGTYTCIARNRFGFEIDRQERPNELTIDRRVRVKSQLAWLWPLILIVVIIVLLITIITLCEFRKKSLEAKLIEETPDDE